MKETDPNILREMREDRPYQLEGTLRQINLTEQVMEQSGQKELPAGIVNGAAFIVDKTVVRIWKGFVEGVYNEMKAEGQGAMAHDIFVANKVP